MISQAAASTGDVLTYDSNLPGGHTFQQHSNNTTSITKIAQGGWDFVVLQEQSQLPSFPDAQVATQVYPFAHKLDSTINVHNPCAETMFYMTWGRKNGDASNCGSWPYVCTYEGMDSLLHLRYMIMAQDNQAVVSPVGAVWRFLRDNHPSIELYQADESHPSVAGSYAAACCFYTAIYRKDPTLITWNSSLSAGDAAIIRQAAKTVVFDNMQNWFIGTHDPISIFTWQQTGSLVFEFDNIATNATDFEWWIDGVQASTSTNFTHSFAASGIYSIQLVSLNCNLSDTMTVNLTVNDATYISENAPLPFTFNSIMVDQLNITSKEPHFVELYELNGRKANSFHLHAGTNNINTSYLASSIYILFVPELGFWAKVFKM